MWKQVGEEVGVEVEVRRRSLNKSRKVKKLEYKLVSEEVGVEV